MSYKKMNKIFYLICIISILVITVYFSLYIIKQSAKPRYMLIVPESPENIIGQFIDDLLLLPLDFPDRYLKQFL